MKQTLPKKIKPNLEHAGALIVQHTGENPERDGLVRTPARYAKAMEHLLAGYENSVAGVVGAGVFPAESNGIVSVNNVEFYTLCEHHLLPFWGMISVAYYPREKIVGLSKIPRLVELFSRRIQVQERLTHQVGEALFELLQPRAVLVRASAQHLCMMMRGVEKQNSSTITEAVFGLENLSEREVDAMYRILP